MDMLTMTNKDKFYMKGKRIDFSTEFSNLVIY